MNIRYFNCVYGMKAFILAIIEDFLMLLFYLKK